MWHQVTNDEFRDIYENAMERTEIFAEGKMFNGEVVIPVRRVCHNTLSIANGTDPLERALKAAKTLGIVV